MGTFSRGSHPAPLSLDLASTSAVTGALAIFASALSSDRLANPALEGSPQLGIHTVTLPGFVLQPLVMPCLECERLERLRDFLSQQNTQIIADYIAEFGSHDPIFVDAVGAWSSTPNSYAPQSLPDWKPTIPSMMLRSRLANSQARENTGDHGVHAQDPSACATCIDFKLRLYGLAGLYSTLNQALREAAISGDDVIVSSLHPWRSEVSKQIKSLSDEFKVHGKAHAKRAAVGKT